METYPVRRGKRYVHPLEAANVGKKVGEGTAWIHRRPATKSLLAVHAGRWWLGREPGSLWAVLIALKQVELILPHPALTHQPQCHRCRLLGSRGTIGSQATGGDGKREVGVQLCAELLVGFELLEHDMKHRRRLESFDTDIFHRLPDDHRTLDGSEHGLSSLQRPCVQLSRRMTFGLGLRRVVEIQAHNHG